MVSGARQREIVGDHAARRGFTSFQFDAQLAASTANDSTKHLNRRLTLTIFIGRNHRLIGAETRCKLRLREPSSVAGGSDQRCRVHDVIVPNILDCVYSGIEIVAEALPDESRVR